MTQGYQRARKPEQKQERKAHLLKTARLLLERDPDLSLLGLNELARQAGMTKSNIYRYFESREELLLALLWEEWANWFSDFSRNSARRRSTGGKTAGVTREFIARLARSLAQRKLLCALTAAVPTVLERNLSEKSVRAFKHGSLQLLKDSGEMLERCHPGLSADEYTRLLSDVAWLMTAIHAHSHPSKAVTNALKDRDLAFFRRDLGSDLERLMQALVRQGS